MIILSFLLYALIMLLEDEGYIQPPWSVVVWTSCSVCAAPRRPGAGCGPQDSCVCSLPLT